MGICLRKASHVRKCWQDQALQGGILTSQASGVIGGGVQRAPEGDPEWRLSLDATTSP